MQYEYLIRNAQILDGTGAPAFQGDVALTGEKIAAVGQLPPDCARQTIDAHGFCLTPGFLDIHRHGDAALLHPDYGQAELAQGLTTVINGNCGLSMAPITGPHHAEIAAYLAPITGDLPESLQFLSIGAYLSHAEQVPLRLHNGMLIGMGTLRACVTGFDDRPLTAEEYTRLHTLLEQALADGALGVSLGLGYAPECFYSTEELIRALAPLDGSGIPVTVHMRQEGDGVVEALEEMLTVARAIRTPFEISHLKAIGRRNWEKSVPRMLELLRQARAEGLEIGCDVYPYPAGSTQLIHVLPPEFQAGGTEALTAALCDPETRQVMRRRMESGTDFENISLLVGFENILATSLSLPAHQGFEGKSIAEIAQTQGKDPFDALFDLLAAEHCAVSMIDFIVSEQDIDAILAEPFAGVISDATYPTTGLLHPRVYGTYPRLLAHYVRECGVLTLPEAIRRITSLPADRFGLRRKGRITPGADADLCLFDLNEIAERGTWQNPAVPAAGMRYVFVDGRPAIAEYQLTEAHNGRMLRRGTDC